MMHAQQSQGANIFMVREAARQSGRYVAVLADLQGPKFRTGENEGHAPIVLAKGQTIKLATGTENCLSVSVNEPTTVVGAVLILCWRVADRSEAENEHQRSPRHRHRTRRRLRQASACTCSRDHQSHHISLIIADRLD